MSQESSLSPLVHRLGNVPGFNIHKLSEDGQASARWYEVDTRVIVEHLVVHDTDLARDLASIAVQIMHWGRLEAQARRVWALAERRYRAWRDASVLEMTRRDPDATSWKKPTAQEVEARYRQLPAYAELSAACERAEEAYNAARLTREAFLAKRDMLRVAVRTAAQGGPTLSV